MLAGLLTEPEELGKVQKPCLYLLMDYNELTVNTQIEIHSIREDGGKEGIWISVSGLPSRQGKYLPISLFHYLAWGCLIVPNVTIYL